MKLGTKGRHGRMAFIKQYLLGVRWYGDPGNTPPGDYLSLYSHKFEDDTDTVTILSDIDIRISSDIVIQSGFKKMGDELYPPNLFLRGIIFILRGRLVLLDEI